MRMEPKRAAIMPCPNARRAIIERASSAVPSSGGGGVIWHRIHLEAHVIPAQAGIHCAGRWKCSTDRLDSRLRGNDRTRELPCLSDDATIHRAGAIDSSGLGRIDLVERPPRWRLGRVKTLGGRAGNLINPRS